MDTRELQLFLDLADSLHFGHTAEAMHMSASAVSRAVQRMEEELGQRLLERDNRSVRLTEAGQQFQAYARQALAQWRGFSDSLRQDAEHLSGEVSVFCSVTAAYSVLSGVLETFRRRYPEIDIKLHTGDQADAVDRVREGGEDIGIAARPERLSSRLQFQTLTHSPLLFIYPRIHCTVEQTVADCVRRGQGIPWDDMPMILSERGVARVRVDQWFRAEGIRPHIYAQVSGNEAIVSMVGLGFGIGVVPELVLAHSPLKEKVAVLDVQPPLAPFAIGLCALRQRLENPLVRAFWQSAREAYRTAP